MFLSTQRSDEIMIDEQSMPSMFMPNVEFQGNVHGFAKQIKNDHKKQLHEKANRLNRNYQSSKLLGGSRLFMERQVEQVQSVTEQRPFEQRPDEDDFTSKTDSDLVAYIKDGQSKKNYGKQLRSQVSLKQFKNCRTKIQQASATQCQSKIASFHKNRQMSVDLYSTMRSLPSHKQIKQTSSQMSLASGYTLPSITSQERKMKHQQRMKVGPVQRSKDEIMLLNMQNIFKGPSTNQTESQHHLINVNDESLTTDVQNNQEKVKSLFSLLDQGSVLQRNSNRITSTSCDDGIFSSSQEIENNGRKVKNFQQTQKPHILFKSFQEKEAQNGIVQRQKCVTQPRQNEQMASIAKKVKVLRNVDTNIRKDEAASMSSDEKPRSFEKKLLLSENSKINEQAAMISSESLHGIQKSIKQTAEKVVYQKYKKSGIRFADTIEHSPVHPLKGSAISFNPLYSRSNEDTKPASIAIFNQKNKKKKKELNQKKLKKEKKENKQRDWPSQDIVNQYTKPNLKYKTKESQEKKDPEDDSFLESDNESSLFNSSSCSSLKKLVLGEKNQKELLKKAPNQIDKLYRLPFGELKASQRVEKFNTRKLQNIGKARVNAKTEIKFRELYDGKRTDELPHEFKVLPNPEDIFEEKRAIEKLIQIEDMNATSKQVSQRNLRQSSTVGELATFGGQNDAFLSFSGHQPSTNLEQPKSILKQKASLRDRPGVLSNNLGQSHLMKMLNKEHQQKVQIQDRLDMKKQYYMQSPTRSKQSLQANSFSNQGSVLQSIGESFRNQSFITDIVINPQRQTEPPNREIRFQMSKSVANPNRDVDGRSVSTRQTNLTMFRNPSVHQRAHNPFQTLRFGNPNKQSSRRFLGFSFRRPTVRNTLKRKPQVKAPVIQEEAQPMFNYDLIQIRNYPGVNVFSDPVHTTQRLYKEMMQNTLQKAQKVFENKEWQRAIDILSLAIPVAQFAFDLHDIMHLYQLISSIEFHRKRFKKALEVCHLVIHMCSNKEALSEIRMQMLKMSGMCQMRLQRYDEALHAWKLTFEHCLKTGNEEAEVYVYEQMSYCFFYLGRMKDAEYFNTRWRMGILEEPDSQMRHIYTQLRKNEERANKWERQVQYTSDINWNGETIFEGFYKNFLSDCHCKEKLCWNLLQGKAFPVFERNRCSLSKRLAFGLLHRVSIMLRKINLNQIAMPTSNSRLELEPKWRHSYHLTRRKNDCDDIYNLRSQIYKVCEEIELQSTFPLELQYELDLIEVQVKADRINQFNNQDKKVHRHRKISVPELGFVTVNDYNLPEMPFPCLVNVNKVRFDFKNSIRNADYREGRQYDSEELKQLFPQLYNKTFKKDPVPKQFTAPQESLPDISDPDYKKNLIQRAQLCSNVRDQIYISHMTGEIQVQGKFKSEKERKKYYMRYFNQVQDKIADEIEQIRQLDPLTIASENDANVAAQVKGTANDLEVLQPYVNLKASKEEQLAQSKRVLRGCMAIRAQIYGMDLTKSLITFNNNLTSAKRIIDAQNGEYRNFNEASFREMAQQLGGQEAQLTECKMLEPVKSKYLTNQGQNSKQETMNQFFASVAENKSNTFQLNLSITTCQPPQLNNQKSQLSAKAPTQNTKDSSKNANSSVRFQSQPQSTSMVSSQGRISPSPKRGPSSFAQSSLSKASHDSDYFERDLDVTSEQSQQDHSFTRPVMSSSTLSSPKRRLNFVSKQVAQSTLKSNIAEVIHEEEIEVTMPKVKEHDSQGHSQGSSSRSASKVFRRSNTVDLSLSLSVASPGGFRDDLLKATAKKTTKPAEGGIKMLAQAIAANFDDQMETTMFDCNNQLTPSCFAEELEQRSTKK